MCGIIAFYQKSPLKLESQKSIIESSLKKMSHRGPDESHIYQSSDFSKGLGHTRLSIIDPSFGAQPFLWEDLQWIHNGEIYNHAHFREEEFKSLFDQSDLSLSDSAIIGPLYKKYGTDFVSKLDGVFSIVILDGDKIIAARDPLVVKPLFYGFDDEERMWFASEMSWGVVENGV